MTTLGQASTQLLFGPGTAWHSSKRTPVLHAERREGVAIYHSNLEKPMRGQLLIKCGGKIALVAVKTKQAGIMPSSAVKRGGLHGGLAGVPKLLLPAGVDLVGVLLEGQEGALELLVGL
eukprot:CAMPEP_0171205034 /NCGR_PEP_ID=MMETSP0790-20130122/26344_1 /TAXON_ID=2925 /ORGANISM="Alexandrium catenella, Strain OF101" /LENGTH=118 /DNA_ID=CAMNT_0011670545 /DNA_START=24 /DNA_END=378 /DNA_ORIENTATION=+